MLDVAIIGGGLSGLSLAKHLLDDHIKFNLFESRDRFGGRIYSKSFDKDKKFTVDLGPSWIWPDDQPLISEFISEHDLEIFAQQNHGHNLFHNAFDSVPQRYSDSATYADAYRLKGGSQILVDHLLQEIPPSCLAINHIVKKLENKKDHIDIHIIQKQNNSQIIIQAKQVVIMLPPRLIEHTVLFQPQLDNSLLNLMHNTPTWMAGHAKTTIVYANNFWQPRGLSGNAYAGYPGSILGEIFDSSSAKGDRASLSGFFALPPNLREKYRHDLPELVRKQMIRLFGSDAAKPQDIFIQDWSTESFTATPMDQSSAPGHPNYGHRFFNMDHWNDKLYFGGTETATHFGGYLEGALQSAKFVAKQLSLSSKMNLSQIT